MDEEQAFKDFCDLWNSLERNSTKLEKKIREIEFSEDDKRRLDEIENQLSEIDLDFLTK